MKKPLLCIACMLMQLGLSFAQQTFPAKAMFDKSKKNSPRDTSSKKSATKNSDTTSSSSIGSRFGIYGIGNINEQALTQINAGGKLSCFFIPFMKETKKYGTFLTNICLSFNVNANNKDSLVEGTILFPDLGNSAFLGTIEAGYMDTAKSTVNAGFKYYIGLLGEFAAKKITASNSDTSVYFNVVSYTGGIKTAAYYQKDTSKPAYSLTVLAYYNYVHIPDKDDGDYRYILKQPSLSGSLNSVGVKVTVGINNLQAFADMRNTFYTGTQVTDRGLYSFNCNVGIILPVQIKTE